MHLNRVQSIRASAFAFAAIKSNSAIDGSNVVTWGNPEAGGDSSAVQEQLREVRHIQSTHFAFAALRADGRVITWGSADAGGDSSAVQDELRDVHMYHSRIRFSNTSRWGITCLTPMSDVGTSALEMSSVCTKRKRNASEEGDDTGDHMTDSQEKDLFLFEMGGRVLVSPCFGGDMIAAWLWKSKLRHGIHLAVGSMDRGPDIVTVHDSWLRPG